MGMVFINALFSLPAIFPSFILHEDLPAEIPREINTLDNLPMSLIPRVMTFHRPVGNTILNWQT